VKKIKIPFFVKMTLAVVFLLFGFTGDPEIALGMAGPAAAAGSYTEAYVSSFDLNMRKVYPKLTARYGDQGVEFIGMLMALGWESTTDVQTIEHYEDEWVWDSFKVNTNAAGAAGAAVTLTINSDSIDSQGNFYPGVKDIIEFPSRDTNGDPIQAYITAKTSTTITVKPLKSAWAVPAVSAGQELIVITNGNSEGSNQLAPKVSGAYRVTNKFAIAKADIEATGSEMTDRTWISQDAQGKPVGAWYSKALNFDLDYRMMQSIQGWFLGGVEPDNSILDPDTGKPIKWTKGIFPTMNEVSIQHPYNDQFNVGDFDEIERGMSRVYAGTLTAAMLGLEVDINLENNLKAYFNFTNIDYVTKQSNAALFGNDEGLAMAVGFNYFEKAKRKFALKRFSTFNNPKTYGATDYDYVNRAFMMPLRNQNVVMDSKGNKSTIPTMNIVYKSLDSYSRKMEVFQTGSANAAKWGVTNTTDNRLWHQRCEFGVQSFAANQWVNIYKG
jgi:hypothetical protein